MKIAIIGPAGSGKTTIAMQLIDAMSIGVHGIGFLSCDELVDEVYSDSISAPEVRYIRKICPQCVENPSVFDKINKCILGTYLLKHDKERRHLEDLFFQRVQTIVEDHDSIIVEGLLPRFLKKLKFDAVFYVHTKPAERRRRLQERGVTPKRIAEIEKVQRKLFKEPIDV